MSIEPKRIGWEVHLSLFTQATDERVMAVIDDALHDAGLCACEPHEEQGGYVMSAKAINEGDEDGF